MSRITTITETVQDLDAGFECLIHLTRVAHMPDDVEIQISIEGYPVGWGCTSHNFVEVMAGGNFRKEWEVLKGFLKPEYFQQIETIIKQWRNQTK